MNDEQEERALRERAQQHLDDAPAASIQELPRRRSGGWRRWMPAAAAAVVVVAVAAGVVAFRHGGSGTPAGPAATRDPHVVLSGDARSAVVHDGDTVIGSGWIMAVPGKPVRFCAPVPVAAVGSVGGSYNPDDDCPAFVVVTGVDLGALADRAVLHGSVRTGSATLVGVYRGGRMAVTDQRAPEPVQKSRLFHDTAPCPAPSGGWPRDGEEADTDSLVAFQRAHPSEVVEVAQLNLSRQQHIGYVLTEGDPDPVRSELQKTYRGPVCVVRSRFSARQLHTANRAVVGRVGRTGPRLPTGSEDLHTMYSGGGMMLDAQEQLVVPGNVPVLGAELAGVVDAQTKDTVQLDVWLVPVRR